MAPLEEAPPEQDPASALPSAGQSLGFCLLTFPISTFSAALLIGLRDSFPQMTSPSPAPLWICLGVCALFFAGAVLSLRSARRSLARAGMPPYELQRQISAMWIVTAALMLALLIGARPRPEAGHLMIMGLFALGSWLCVLLVRRSRRHLEAAGLSQEEIRGQMASFWRSGAFMMIVNGGRRPRLRDPRFRRPDSGRSSLGAGQRSRLHPGGNPSLLEEPAEARLEPSLNKSQYRALRKASHE